MEDFETVKIKDEVINLSELSIEELNEKIGILNAEKKLIHEDIENILSLYV